MSASAAGPDVATLVPAARVGDRRAVARLLTIVERGGPDAEEVADLTHASGGGAAVVGITGAPGSGKSTLTGGLVGLLADLGHRPAVLAVDPSSPLSGGAILGDRVRMDGGDEPGRAFIRSMATRGHQGGLALAVPGAIRVLDHAGFEPVIVETVGVGQVEVDVVGAADTTVVVVTPGMGDAVQANKAGLLELADVFVVNKADRPGAEDVRRDLEQMLDLSHITGREDSSGRRPDIIPTVATEGSGCESLWEAIEAHLQHLDATGGRESRRRERHRQEIRDWVEVLLAAEVEAQLAADPSVSTGFVSPASAARAVVDELLGPDARRSISP